MEVRYLCTQQSPTITHQEKGSQRCASAVADRQFIWDESLNSGLQPFLKSYPLPLHKRGCWLDGKAHFRQMLTTGAEWW